MAIKGGDPILEKQNWSIWFFGLCAFLFLSYGAVLYQEFVSRRTYVHYQKEFREYELGKVTEEFNAFKQSWDASKEPEFTKRISEAEAKKASPEYEKLLEERETAFFDLGFKKSELSKKKSLQDAKFYDWKHAQHQGHEEVAKAEEARYWELQKQIDEWTGIVQEAEAKLAGLDKQIAGYGEAIELATKEYEEYRAPYAAFEERLEKISSRSVRTVDQIVNNELGIGGHVTFGTVDRCRSCHVAIDRPGFEEASRTVFKTHPKIDPIFTNHPIDSYGCTVCHQGQGRATRIKHGLFDSPDAMVKGEDGEEHPKYVFAHDLDQAHGTTTYWEEPLYRGDFLQASCNRCHAEQRWVDEAPVYEKGKDLFLSKGCTGCHTAKGWEENPRVGPELTRLQAKVTPEWLVDWIYNPKAFYPETRMPMFVFDEYQVGAENPADNVEAMENKALQKDVATKMAAYLWQSSNKPKSLPYGAYPGGGNAANGLKVIETVGCLGCHSTGTKGTQSAPPLHKAGAKLASADWIYNWVRDPRWHSDTTIMPSLRLSEQEARDVTAWLWAAGAKERKQADPALAKALSDPKMAEEGGNLIAQWGCAGCHVIEGHEKDGRIGPELTLFGEKKPYELGFGDSHVEHSWRDWTEGKIHNPRQYVDVRSAARMPWFGLNEDEIHALTVYLQGMKSPRVPAEYDKKFVGRAARIERGRALVNQYNCVGCHLIEGRGGEILAINKDRKLRPPNLNMQGTRIQADYMQDFLKNPTTIRPWLDIRMPTFPLSDDERQDIITYFRAVDGIDTPYDEVNLAELSPELVPEGEKHFQKLQCTSCHIWKGQRFATATDDKVAPDLANVWYRFRPEGVKVWLEAPQKVMPGTNMPGFFYDWDKNTGKLEPIAKEPAKDIEAVRSYLYSIGKGKGSVSMN